MGFQEAVLVCLTKKYADFSGRASRPEFWWFALFQFLLIFVLGFVSSVVSFIVALALLVPSLAVGVRRLQDIGKSGWLILLALIPIVGLILIYFFVQPSK
ncbi:MAG: DUF805 domain-containing protein [Zoogloeaceae bacterium]|jgi:uncharacterized membrane protein YhaH (DUF805 family)|nr:DUF805 domain-containing protein [Zoogloeaceae bacterium]